MPTAKGNGILFGPDDKGISYIALFYHRGAPTIHKSTWLDDVPQAEEYGIFCGCFAPLWRDSAGHYWGIRDGGNSELAHAAPSTYPLPRFPPLEVCGRRPRSAPRHLHGPASENLHNKRRSKLYAQDRLTIAISAQTEHQLHTSTISALNTCIDSQIEPLSPEKPRGTVTLNVQAGAT
jgi:hypothetical protein